MNFRACLAAVACLSLSACISAPEGPPPGPRAPAPAPSNFGLPVASLAEAERAGLIPAAGEGLGEQAPVIAPAPVAVPATEVPVAIPLPPVQHSVQSPVMRPVVIPPPPAARAAAANFGAAPLGNGSRGVLVFGRQPSSGQPEDLALCEAYADTAVAGGSLRWLGNDGNAFECTELLAVYNHAGGRELLTRLGKGGSAGPFLLGWSPQSGPSYSDSDVLIVDLNGMDVADARGLMSAWSSGQLSRAMTPRFSWDMDTLTQRFDAYFKRYGYHVISVLNPAG